MRLKCLTIDEEVRLDYVKIDEEDKIFEHEFLKYCNLQDCAEIMKRIGTLMLYDDWGLPLL